MAELDFAGAAVLEVGLLAGNVGLVEAEGFATLAAGLDFGATVLEAGRGAGLLALVGLAVATAREAGLLAVGFFEPPLAGGAGCFFATELDFALVSFFAIGGIVLGARLRFAKKNRLIPRFFRKLWNSGTEKKGGWQSESDDAQIRS